MGNEEFQMNLFIQRFCFWFVSLFVCSLDIAQWNIVEDNLEILMNCDGALIKGCLNSNWV